mmetsp:Transcript_25797/g.62152  ORF Transcript_25797/g.62152 Transcript_25797/m.62152 type:complete len:647 (-) Transcript_25797:60-2000(-)
MGLLKRAVGLSSLLLGLHASVGIGTKAAANPLARGTPFKEALQAANRVPLVPPRARNRGLAGIWAGDRNPLRRTTVALRRNRASRAWCSRGSREGLYENDIAEIRNWVRLGDGRFQGEVFKRRGVAEGKVIATSKAKILSPDTIETDTGTRYRLNPPFSADTVVDSTEDNLHSLSDATSETASAARPVKKEYDPFKALLKNLGTKSEDKGASFDRVSTVTASEPPSLKTGMEESSRPSIEAPLQIVAAASSEPSPREARGTELLSEAAAETVKATGADVIGLEEEEAEASNVEVGGKSTSEDGGLEVLDTVVLEPGEPEIRTTASIGISPKGPGNAQIEGEDIIKLLEKEETKLALPPFQSDTENFETEDEDLGDEEEIDAVMPGKEVREQALEEDTLMTKEIADTVSKTERAISKKGTGWLTNLLAKGSAALVNSPVNVNNQFNTVIQYNFGDGQKRTLSECKTELLMAISGVERGLKVSEEIADKIDKLIRAMEAGNPTKTPLKNPLLNGRWALLYTTAKGILGEGSVFKPKGPIYQSIDIFGLRILNEQAYEPVPFVRWTTSAAGDLFPKSNSRTEVKFEQYRVGGVKVVAPPSDPARQMIEWELQVSGKGTPAWLDNTYVDENLRVARDHKGNVFVMKRDDP